MRQWRQWRQCRKTYNKRVKCRSRVSELTIFSLPITLFNRKRNYCVYKTRNEQKTKTMKHNLY